MNDKAGNAVADHAKTGPAATRKQIRGSSLLLAGRGLSVALNFATQVLIVRYLSKSDFGAWAYSLALVGFLQVFATFGLDRATPRFVPIFHERNDYPKLFGTIFLVLATVLVVGFVSIGAVHVAPDLFAALVGGKQEYPVDLLLILIFLVPVHGIDETLIGLFASFSRPRAIFFRKHVVGPVLKLAVALLLIAYQSSVVFLAYGFLLASLAAVVFYIWVLLRELARQGLLQHFRMNAVVFPAREIFAFTIPLLSSDLVAVAMHSSDTLLLGYFHNTEAVASYGVILPLAHVNTIVMSSFGLLYTPLAARLFARSDFAGINELYWRTAIWLSVLSFPVFAVTFSAAKPLTALLYGVRYEDSWLYLQLLALAYYFNVALGMNGLTLKVLGKVRYVVIINVIALVINVILNLLLIPLYGALGAAISTAASMVCHNLLKQAGLRLASGLALFEWHYLSFYLVIAGGALALFLLQSMVTSSIYILLPVALVVSLTVIKICQRHLKVEETFPELLKLPLLRYLVT